MLVDQDLDHLPVGMDLRVTREFRYSIPAGVDVTVDDGTELVVVGRTKTGMIILGEKLIYGQVDHTIPDLVRLRDNRMVPLATCLMEVYVSAPPEAKYSFDVSRYPLSCRICGIPNALYVSALGVDVREHGCGVASC